MPGLGNLKPCTVYFLEVLQSYTFIRGTTDKKLLQLMQLFKYIQWMVEADRKRCLMPGRLTKP